MSVNGHSKQKYQDASQMFQSSAGRNWPELLAETWCHREADYGGFAPVDTEIGILLKGNTRVTRCGDGTQQDTIATPGTIWICPAGIHEDSVNVRGDMEEVLHLFIPENLFSESALREFDIDPANIQLRYEGGFQDPFIEQVGRLIARELAAESPASLLLIDTLRAALSAHLLKNYSNIAPNKLKLDRSKGALDQRRINKIRDYVLSNIHRSLTLDKLADQACLSPYHFARAFKTAVGLTPHQFVMQEKINCAKRLISTSETSLLEVAYTTGFSTQAHFTRAFKRATGLTPGSYRAKSRF